MSKIKILMSYVIIFTIILCGCSGSENDDKNNNNKNDNAYEKNSENSVVKEFEIDSSINENYTNETYDSKAEKIDLKETITISNAGTYILSGDIENGQIIVNCNDSDKVRLVLDGVNVNCSNGSAINVVKGKTIITLAKGSKNTLADGTVYANEDESACVYSKDDLCINGSGSLDVIGNYDAGIQCKDDLRIVNGDITVNSVGDGVKGKDSVVIANGKIEIKAGKDGIQSTNTESEKGYVLIKGGEISVSCASDGIKAESIVEINDGEIDIKECGEGIEAIYARINGGDIKIKASDDGVNVSDGSGVDAGGKFAGGNKGGFGNKQSASGVVPTLYINGGNLYIDANGDGIDSNGAIYINGGTVKVDGPTSNGNGFFDCATAFEVKGGEIIGCGSGGMMEVPGDNSTQNTIVITGIDGAAGDVIVIKDSGEKELMKYEPAKAFQALVYSEEGVKNGETYKAYKNDEEIGSVTVSQVVNYIGEMNAGMQGGWFGGKDFEKEEGQMPPNMPEGEGQMPPNMPGWDGKTPPNMPEGEGQTPPDMPGDFFGGGKPQRPNEIEEDDNSL